MSAAALVRRRWWRSSSSSATTPASAPPHNWPCEHALPATCARMACPCQRSCAAAAGATAVTCGDFVYEVHEVAEGVDCYRDAVSWSPFTSLGHARAAGAALARLHEAAAGFPLPPRAPGRAHKLMRRNRLGRPARGGESRSSRQRPGLARYLDRRYWQRTSPAPSPRDPAGRATGQDAEPAVGARGLASVQPHLDLRRC